MQEWDQLVADVARLKGLPASVDAGFSALKRKLEDVINNAGIPADQVAAVHTDVAAAVDAIQASVVANTAG